MILPPASNFKSVPQQATMAARLSSAPRWLPGRFTISVFPLQSRYPARKPCKRIALGALSTHRLGQSRGFAIDHPARGPGVRSRGPRPVPPTVSTSAAPCGSNSSELRRNRIFVVGQKRSLDLRARPVLRSNATTAGPAVSSAGPASSGQRW